MKRKLIAPLIALALIAAGAAAHAGDGKDRKDHAAARAALARGEIQPLARILAAATRVAPGDVIKVELEEEKGRLIYEVKVLGRDGRVREVELDARTAATLKVEDD